LSLESRALAPIVGGVLGALVYQLIAERDTVSDAAVMGVDDTGPDPNTRDQ
jgi:hypothetical protein